MSLPAHERKTLILIALARSQHGRAPSWSQLRAHVDMPNDEHSDLMWSLRNRGLLRFSYEPGSAELTKEGTQAALDKPQPRSRP